MLRRKKRLIFEEEKNKAKFNTISEALNDILRINCKKPGAGGDVPDWETTVRQIKLRARMALDFVGCLDDKDKDEKNKSW